MILSAKDKKDWKPKSDLNHSVTFYLPSRRKDGTEIGRHRHVLIHAVMNFLLIELGGATQVEGTGYFVGEDKRVHEEATTLCKAFCTQEDLDKHGWKINRLANAMAIEFEQESMAVEIDGTFYCYSPKKSYVDQYKADRKAGKLSDYQHYLIASMPDNPPELEEKEDEIPF